MKFRVVELEVAAHSAAIALQAARRIANERQRQGTPRATRAGFQARIFLSSIGITVAVRSNTFHLTLASVIIGAIVILL
jgi:hypothetical protein